MTILCLFIQQQKTGTNFYLSSSGNLLGKKAYLVSQIFFEAITQDRKVHGARVRDDLVLLGQYKATYVLLGEMYVVSIVDAFDSIQEAHQCVERAQAVLSLACRNIDLTQAVLMKKWSDVYFALEEVVRGDDGRDVIGRKALDPAPRALPEPVESRTSMTKSWRDVQAQADDERTKLDMIQKFETAAKESRRGDTQLPLPPSFGPSFIPANALARGPLPPTLLDVDVPSLKDSSAATSAEKPTRTRSKSLKIAAPLPSAISMMGPSGEIGLSFDGSSALPVRSEDDLFLHPPAVTTTTSPSPLAPLSVQTAVPALPALPSSPLPQPSQPLPTSPYSISSLPPPPLPIKLTLVETVNAAFRGAELTAYQLVGEVSISASNAHALKPEDKIRFTLSLANPDQSAPSVLDKVACNPQVARETAPGTFSCEIPAPLISAPGSSVVVAKLKAIDTHQPIPIRALPQAQIQETVVNLLFQYAVNPVMEGKPLQELSFLIPANPTITVVQSKPPSEWNDPLKKSLWKVEDCAPVGKLMARLIRSEPGGADFQPLAGPILCKFSSNDHSLMGLSVGLADQTDSSKKLSAEAGIHRRVVSGKYSFAL